MSLVDSSITHLSSTLSLSMEVSQWMTRLESSEEVLTSLLAQQVVFLITSKGVTSTFQTLGQLSLTKLTRCSNSALKKM